MAYVDTIRLSREEQLIERLTVAVAKRPGTSPARTRARLTMTCAWR